MPSKIAIDASGSSPPKDTKKKAKAGGEDQKKKMAMVGIAVVCLLAAAGVTAFQMGLIGGAEKPLTAAETGGPLEFNTPEEKKKYERQLELIQRQTEKLPKAGA